VLNHFLIVHGSFLNHNTRTTSSMKIKSKTSPPRFGVFGAFPELLSGTTPLEGCWEEGAGLNL
jgi:hypothetical protein